MFNIGGAVLTGRDGAVLTWGRFDCTPSRKCSGDALQHLKVKSNESMLIHQQELELRKQQKVEAKEKQQQKQDEQIQKQQK